MCLLPPVHRGGRSKSWRRQHRSASHRQIHVNPSHASSSPLATRTPCLSLLSSVSFCLSGDVPCVAHNLFDEITNATVRPEDGAARSGGCFLDALELLDEKYTREELRSTTTTHAGARKMDASISASQGAMRSLPGKLESLLLGSKHGLRPEEKNKLRILQGDLQGLIANYLLEPSEVESPASTANFWMKDVRDLSYDIEDFLDELTRAGTSGSRISAIQKPHRVKIFRFPEKLKRHQWIAAEISGFRIRVKEAIERHKSYLVDCKWRPSCSGGQLGECQHPAALSCHQAAIPLVGVDSSIKQLCCWLANDGQPEHKVVSIVGTCGVGKTTLAKEVYRKLGGQFECRAFVHTSRKPDMKRLFTSILSQVRRHQLPDSCEVHQLALNINEHLQDKTYIIVVDDLWASSTWGIINQALPKGNCCSRILTTTELDTIAQTCYADSSKYMPYKKEGNSKYILKKEPLSEDESKELLSTVFGFQAECPQGLKEVSDGIVKKCGGLPLTINILASLLAHQPASSIEQWNYIKNSLSSDLSTDDSLEGIKQVLNLGYDNLPHGLKACMLYMCLYEEDCVIWKGDLVKQWMAEGFVCPGEGGDGKEVAQSYFDELVNRGMIQPVHINCNDEILSCKVHHMVLRFIRYKSIEENFCIAIDHSQVTIRLADKVRRLALHFDNVEDATPPLESMRLSQVRSLAFSGLLKCMPSIVEFRFLQVLILKLCSDPDNRSDNLTGPDDLSGNITEPDDLSDNLTEPDDLSYNLTEISELFRLRYFHLDACHMSVELPTQMRWLKDLVAWEIDAVVTAVASDIVDLPGLFYLSIPSEAHLPTGIGRMTSLRTLQVVDLSKNSTENVTSLGELTNLQDLHLISSTLQPGNLKKNLECLGSVIRKLSNLKCVTLVPAVSSLLSNQHDAGASSMVISWTGFTIEHLSPALLQKLEFSRHCCIFSSLPEWTNELTKLCFLKIALRKMSSEDFSILKALPSLAALSLFVSTSPVKRIMFDNEGFLVLKYFKFVCAAPCLAFLDGAMPKLQNLKLGFNANRMEQYSLIAAGFERLTGLNKISTKIGGAGADECERRSIEWVFTDAVRKHPSSPIINVQWVDWNFFVDDEKNIEDQKEIWKQTSEKQGMTVEERDEHGIQENNLEEDAKKQADIRYGTNSARSDGMLLLRGGRDTSGTVLVAKEAAGDLECMIQQLSLDLFKNESRRMHPANNDQSYSSKKPLSRPQGLHKKIISLLLRPRNWNAPAERAFFLDSYEVGELCYAAEQIFMQEPTILQLKAPVKVFGDLHGQFGDLMRLFDEYGYPSIAGDITYIDYLFLGDYVDRGQHSLETITLLLALKIEYPEQVHLIRGNHEVADINALFGFRLECIERMGESDGIWAWTRINQLFNYLPLSAMIEKKIICMHGGIGRSISTVEQIENIERPITIDVESIILKDLLRSNPTENDSVEGLKPNARVPGLVTFGPDRVTEFCKRNKLQLIIRAHECVMDGFERFAHGQLITLFSATNYCGTANNAGAIIVVGRELVIVPKLIYPLPPPVNSPKSSPERAMDAAWMQELNIQRPPTPTRGRRHYAREKNSIACVRPEHAMIWPPESPTGEYLLNSLELNPKGRRR